MAFYSARTSVFRLLRRSSPVVLLVLLGAGGGTATGASPTDGTDSSPSPGWQAQVQQDIAAQEYHLSWQAHPSLATVEASWHAPNRAHNFRTYFTDRGIRVVPRQQADSAWDWGLTLVGYGQGANRWHVAEATLAPIENRIEYKRGDIDEWYINDARGLEQGFNLWAAPAEAAAVSGAARTHGRVAIPGRGRDIDATRLVYLDLELEGSLLPMLSTDGQAIDFAIPGGARVVHYAKLVVTDATGEKLPAWMEGVADETVSGVRIVMDAREAVYPIAVDPLATTAAWTAEGNQTSSQFGAFVATAGDVNGDGFADVIVGADLYDSGEINEGRAYVYLGSVTGLATTPVWTAESNQVGAFFGRSVSAAGDVNGDGYADVIVGAENYDNPSSAEGRAYVYHGSASGVSAAAAWTAESDQSVAFLGGAVSTAGDVNGDGYADVIVGAPLHDGGGIDRGRAYVYHGSASGLSTSPDWTDDGPNNLSEFGESVSTAGDVNGDGYADVIVGSGGTGSGRAFVYHGSPSGVSTTPDWTAQNGQTADSFGESVSTAGDVNGDGYADVIVGAPRYDNGETNEGRVFVFHGSASGLAGGPSAGSDDAAWTVESDQAGAELGGSVSTAGDVNGDGYADVTVGASLFDGDETDEGRALLYYGSASGLTTVPDWTPEGDQAAAGFGYAVSTAGDVNGDGYADVIVGAPFHDGGESQEGRAYLYLGSASGVVALAWTEDSDQDAAQYGFSVDTAGDVNGDGFADVIVGALLYDNGQVDEGQVYVYLGSATGLATAADWTAESDQAGALFGAAAGTAGDVNGDGYADVIVGANRYTHGQAEEGRTFVYLGSAAGLAGGPNAGPGDADWTAESDQASAWFGISAATAGDVNGDGYADVIVGAEFYDNDQTNEGQALVYLGSAAGLAPTPNWTAEGDQNLSGFGTSVATAGDVNGDGYADVIVGASNYDNLESNEGAAFVYLGSAAGPAGGPNAGPGDADWTAESDQADAEFGTSVATAGDVNGDGFADVVVGATFYDNVENDEGGAFVYLGSAAGLDTNPAWTAESDQADAQFGNAVSTAGDVNGDGFAEVIVGARHYNGGEAQEGGAFVYLGSAAGLTGGPNAGPGDADWTAESQQIGARFGFSVATAGDVNGDGYADVIVGARLYNLGQTDDGRAYLYLGNEGAGLSVQPQQRRSNDAGPIAHGGRSRDLSFRLAALGRTPFGRSRVKLEWEVKPLGIPFDGIGTQQSAGWIDTGTAGATLNELTTQYSAGALHWRLRLLYDPVTTPFASASRWLTVPWNGWEETDLIMGGFIGGVVWEDRDGDGIRDGSEPAIGGIVVNLLDSGDTLINATVTASDGTYVMEVPGPGPVKMQVLVPGGFLATTPDQGGDDLLDSDISTVTGETALIGPMFDPLDAVRWSGGLRQTGACFAPDEALYIATERQVAGATVLDIQDPNQSSQVSGYNIYRSSDAGLDPALWPLLASDVVDQDGGTPNIQYVDDTGDVSPTGAWFYQTTAYNSVCDAEGPR